MHPSQNRIKIHKCSDLPALTKLEISKLGRPWHKLPDIMNDNFDIFDARLGVYFLKKFRVNVSLKNMMFEIDKKFKNAQIFITPYGHIAFSIDRALLLQILSDYYGLQESGDDSTDTSLPVTKTEERLAARIGQDIVHLILSNEIFKEALEIKNDYLAVISQWAWCVTFSLEGYEQGDFSIFLDSHHVDLILARIRAASAENSSHVVRNSVSPAEIEKLFYSLPLVLHGRMVTLNLTIAQLSEIRPGDILPISLNEPVPIFVGKEQLFDATIAENRGKLFLCDLQDKISEKHHE